MEQGGDSCMDQEDLIEVMDDVSGLWIKRSARSSGEFDDVT
jgi:hypothetical protein